MEKKFSDYLEILSKNISEVLENDTDLAMIDHRLKELAYLAKILADMAKDKGL